TEPVDELVEVEAVGRHGGRLWHRKACQELGCELQPRWSIREFDERFDVEHREATSRTGPLFDPVARQQLLCGAMNQDCEEEQRRDRELFDAGAAENRLDHLWASENIVGVPRSAVELVAQALAGDVKCTRQHDEIPLLEIQALACHLVSPPHHRAVSSARDARVLSQSCSMAATMG